MSSRTIEEIWSDDKLDRQQDARWLATFLRNQAAEESRSGQSYVLNIDSEWGGGKTFFLKRFQEQLEADGHLAIYVNAWRDDFAEDPMVAVMAAINEAVAPHIPERSPMRKRLDAITKQGGRIAWELGKGASKKLISYAVGTAATEAVGKILESSQSTDMSLSDTADDDIGEASSDVTLAAIEKVLDERAEKAVSAFQEARSSLDAFRSRLAAFVSAIESDLGKATPLFVLIDELDRCRPTYAISMLERVQHIFELPGVVFVIATDSGQLGESIKAAYGAGFDSTRYLKKFFSRTYTFEEPSTKQLISHLLQAHPIPNNVLSSPLHDEHGRFLTEFFDRSRTPPRSIEHLYDQLRNLAAGWSQPGQIELVLALPLLVAQYDLPQKEAARVQLAGAVQYIPLNWKLKVQNFQTGRSEDYEMRQIAQDMINMSNQSLLTVINEMSDPGNEALHWVRRRVENEFHSRYAGRPVNQRQGYPSHLPEYPRFIRQAGRVQK